MRTLRVALVLGLPLLALQLARGHEDGAPLFLSLAPSLANLSFGLAGVLLVFRILEELFDSTVALCTSVLLLFGTFLFAQMTGVAGTAPTVAFFAAALVVAVWWPARFDLHASRALRLGLLLGMAAAVRPQNGLLLLLPAASLLAGRRHETGRRARTGLVVLGGFAAGLLAFGVAFGPLPLGSAGAGEALRHLLRPHLLQTFFSSRNGLLFWTPVLWGGFLGFVWLVRRDSFTGLALAAPLLLMSYLNSCAGGGDDVASGRFASALPLLALGLGASLASVKAAVQRRPLRVAWAAGFLFVLWNQLLVVQYREKKIPADDTVSFAAVAETNARIFGRYLGTPLAWPANWLFARAHDLPAARYDLMVGKRLLDGENNLGGVVRVGDGRADPALFAGEWSAPARCGEARCREVRGRARVMAPLEEAEDLDLEVQAFGRGTLAVAINGLEVASFPLEAAPRSLRVRVPRRNWRRDLNDVSLSVGDGGSAFVERLVFARPGQTATGGSAS